MELIKKVTPTVWARERRRVVELAKEGLVKTDLRYKHSPSLEPGEVSVALMDHLYTASQAPGSTVFQQALIYFICEGRHNYKGYSCCADVAHTILALMGCRETRMINRDDDNADGVVDEGEKDSKWRTQQNINMLYQGAKQLGIWVPGTSKELPSPGDVMVIQVLKNGKRQHVLCVHHLEDDPATGSRVMVSIDGGQKDSGGQCLKRRRRVLKKKGRYWVTYKSNGSEDRGVLGWIDVGKLKPFITTSGWSLPSVS